MVGDANRRDAGPGGNLRKHSGDTVDILLKVRFAVRPNGCNRLREVDSDNHIEMVLRMDSI